MFAIYLNLFLGFLEELVFCLCLYSFMKHNSRDFFRPKALTATGFLFLGIGTYLFTILGHQLSFPWLAILFDLFYSVLLGYLLFHRKAKALFFDLLFTVLLILCMEIGIFVMNVIGYLFADKIGLAVLGNLAMIVKILVMISVTFVSRLWLFRFQGSLVEKRQAFAILVLPVCSLLLLFSLLELCSVYVQFHGLFLLLLDIGILVFLNFFFFYLWIYLLRSNKLEGELELFQTQSQIQYRHYEQLEQKYQESRKIIHDMKNHLASVEHLYQDTGNTQGQQYVRDLYHMLNVMGERYYTSCKMLNIICNDKLSFARNKGISVTAELGDVDFSDLRDIDITTIFANLLDNAIEACEGFENPFLNFQVQTIQNFRVIRLTNSWKPGEKKKGHMGIGLKNVQQTLERYAGTMSIEPCEQEYRISIMLPGKENL